MKLEVRDVTYQYGEKEGVILQDFSFSMTNQERVGLVAPSGVGKTTLCKLISRLSQTGSGTDSFGWKRCERL